MSIGGITICMYNKNISYVMYSEVHTCVDNVYIFIARDLLAITVENNAFKNYNA